jgi:hypothetical protein
MSRRRPLNSALRSLSVVIPGFRPGIHEFAGNKLVDAKAKPWHDDRESGTSGAQS